MQNDSFIKDEIIIGKLSFVYLRDFPAHSKYVTNKKMYASLFYVLSGEIECIKNGIKTVIGKDDFFFWDAGDNQIIHNRSDTDCHTYVIGFNYTTEGSVHTDYMLPSYGHIENVYFLNLFSKIHQGWNERRIGYKVKTYSLFYNILYNIISLTNADSIPTEKYYKLQKVVQYIYTSLNKDIRIEDLCNISGYSRVHLNRLFLEQYQLSPNKFLIKARISRAKILLEHTQHSIAEIAELTGFKDIGYFCRTFKKETEYTPLQYKHLYFVENS